MSTIGAGARHDLTDAQWEVLQPLLPPPSRVGRPRVWPLRSLIDGVRHRVRGGYAWRDVPERYGPWWRVYGLFACWQVRGVWERIETALLAQAGARGLICWQVSVDSTISRGHVHAAGARRDSVNRHEGEPDHHGFGRSRGGWGTKTHLVAEQGRGVLAFHCTPGQGGDAPEMIAVLEQIKVPGLSGGPPRRRPERVLADKAYSSRANRSWLRAHHIKATIAIPADQIRNRAHRGSRGGRPPTFEAETYKDRHAVECAINKLKQYRAFATRYDKLDVRFDATTRIANIDLWLKRLTRTPNRIS